MKVMCVYDNFVHDTSPGYGDICHVALIHYNAGGEIEAYSLQEHPQPHPYRFGARYRGPGGRLCPTFIPIEAEEAEEEEIDVLELVDSIFVS